MCPRNIRSVPGIVVRKQLDNDLGQLLHGHGLGRIPGLIDVAAAAYGYVLRRHLPGVDILLTVIEPACFDGKR
jgi:hypothetical protein